MPLLKAVCLELGHSDKLDEMMEKFRKKIEVRTYKNPNKPKRPKSAYFFFCDDSDLLTRKEKEEC